MTNTYYDTDETEWIIGQLKTTTTDAKSPDDITGVIKNIEYQYYTVDETHFPLLKAEIIEPGHENSVVSTYDYDSYGHIISIIADAPNYSPDPPHQTLAPRVILYDYSNSYNKRFLTKMTDGLNNEETYTYDPVSAYVLTTTDIGGLILSCEYGAFGHVEKVTSPDGVQTSSVLRWVVNEEDAPYYACYNSWSQSSGNAEVITYYDKSGKEHRSVSKGYDDETIYVDTRYDSQGRIDRVSDPYFKNDQANYTEFEYDYLDRTIEVKLPSLPGEQRTVSTLYNGPEIESEDAKGQTHKKYTNAAGWLVKTTDNRDKSVDYQYYGDGKLKETIDPNANPTSITYDVFGNMESIVDPGHGLIEYEYNAFGELIEKTKNGLLVLEDARYDVLGRITEKTEHESLTTYSYFDEGGGIGLVENISLDYIDDDGNELSVSESFLYDNLGRLTTISENIDSEIFNTSFTYDDLGRSKEITYPSLNGSGLKISNRYNQYGYLTSIRKEGGEIIWQVDEMNARGQLKRMKLGNNVQLSRNYNPITGLLHEIKAGNNGQTSNIQYLEYFWDKLNNLDSRKDHNKNQGDGQLETFTYDDLNRLTNVHLNGSETFNMDYDELGNIDFKTDVGDYDYSQTDNAGPHAVTSIDANPGVISDQDQFIKYTSFDKIFNIMEGTMTLNIVYGINKERKRQTINDGSGNIITKTYVGGLYERVEENGNIKEIHYLSSLDGLFAIYTRENETNENLSYILKDHLGSVHCLLDEEGNLFEEYSFDAWGNRRNPQTWQAYTQLPDFSIDRGFTGHEHLDLFALINMNGRVYDPVTCRFLSPDAFVQDPANLQSFNRYSYVFNNPLKFIDPSGYFTQSFLFGNNQIRSGPIGPGSGNHWSDQGVSGRGEAWNFAFMNSSTYDKIYGDKAYDTGVFIFTNDAAVSWFKGDISLSSVQNEGGVWVTVSTGDLVTTYDAELNKAPGKWIPGPEMKPVFIRFAQSGGSVTNWGVYLTGVLLTGEDVYNNFGHNHKTYTTTRGVTKNIRKANGAIRSARAGRFATASKIVKWTGITATAFMTGLATYNIVDDVSNNRSVSGWDIADGSVGVIGLTGAGLTSVGIISNPVGWGVGAGVAIYSWGRLWYDLGAKYGPSKWYGTNDYKLFE